MQIETNKKNICINQIIEQKIENYYVEGDCIIPDIKPDILSVISTSGIVCTYKKELLDGKVRIDGSIDTYMMYLADDENASIRGINSNIDFTQIIDAPKATQDMMLDMNVKIKSIECKVLNGRKVTLKALIEIEAKISSNEDVELIEEIKIEDMQMLNKEYLISSLIGSGSTRAYAKDTIMIDNIDNLGEILKVDAKLINSDKKISYNKVLAKSELCVKIMYLTTDNRINMVERLIPVMGFIDIQSIEEENICDVKYEMKNIVIKPNSIEDHSIYVESEIEISCCVYQNQQIKVIEDLYSPSKSIDFTKKQIKVMKNKEVVDNVCSIRERHELQELKGNKIYDVEIDTVIEKQTILNDRILYEGELKLNFIYASNTRELDTKIVKLPFSHNIDLIGVNTKSKVDTQVEISMQNFIVSSDNMVEIKIDVMFLSSVSSNLELSIIKDITKEEVDKVNMYNMIVYFAKKEDTLWTIAKKFGSTMEEIVRINGIGDCDKINNMQQLFIPRYNG